MKDLINNWENSAKYKSYKAKLSKIKQERMNPEFILKNINQMKAQKVFLTKNELEKVLDKVLFYASIQEDDFMQADFVVEAKINQYTKKELYLEYTKKMVDWYFYLSKYLLQDEFELCAKIRDVISEEEKEFINNISFHFDYDKEEPDSIKHIGDFIKEQLSICK